MHVAMRVPGSPAFYPDTAFVAVVDVAWKGKATVKAMPVKQMYRESRLTVDRRLTILPPTNRVSTSIDMSGEVVSDAGAFARPGRMRTTGPLAGDVGCHLGAVADLSLCLLDQLDFETIKEVTVGLLLRSHFIE